MIENLLKILVCDDSMLIRKKLKELLKSCGCNNILEASNGQEAVDSYKENNPDLVFMDIIMPFKNGIEAVKEIIEFDNDAKVVMASSAGTKEHVKVAIKAGAFEFVQKPWEKEQINKILLNLK
ncbi:response regulator [Clostridium estertheticum]|uniref:Stage 0 sporulation protein A homolog n=1 Tax=Clostridium estertheticum TaxID=238834 RepID=A0A7Y3SXV3_9CLOT|nr:response regulator [Clostridium estertheticum]MCB2355587.1 response regulator [Clostridium estertheticum]MCB2360761.1 response regulator [Clostridium estertheticum]NNU77177.1 response regulator [Clostridium estertheticum]WAG39290.1 response regulator [Clostridium estertheticum]WBL45619.1 response regulator [Clostridium estertheticum]